MLIQNNTITASTNNNNTFVIEPLAYKPSLGEKPGIFRDMRRDETPKKNGNPRRDVVLDLEMKDETGQVYSVPFRFNMLERGRGKAEFKKQMESFLGKPLTPVQLAGFDKELIVGKPVTVRYKKGLRDGVTFDKFLPALAEPAAS